MQARESRPEGTGETFVALDLETTGLDPNLDEIIEIGAIKFSGSTVLGTFHTLVNPLRALPPVIQALTGITPAELEKAPTFSKVADGLADFLGFSTIVGQSVSFDLSFLKAKGIQPVGLAYDTRDLAQILVPHLPEYSLKELTIFFGVEQSQAHRALADAQAAQDVFQRLVAQAEQFESSVLEELAGITAMSEMPLKHLFRQLSDRKGVQALAAPLKAGVGGFPARLPQAPPPLVPTVAKHPLNVDELERILEPGGPVSQSVPAFEERPQQMDMLRAIAEAFNEGKQLLVEAGTGVGKSLAYLLPALLFAVRNSARVVISTHTINLQEQLIEKDIPTLVEALRGHPDLDTETMVAWPLKGRGNYLCLKRWSSFNRTQGMTAEETKLLCRTLVWLNQTRTGDRSELHLANREARAWDKVSAQSLRSPAKECPFFQQGHCFVSWNRQQAESAHLLVVNHALLLADLAKGGGVLPEYDYLIVDEAHHLEEVATQQLGFETGLQDAEELFSRLGQDLPSGLVREILSHLDRGKLSADRVTTLEELGAALIETSARARRTAQDFFQALRSFVMDQSQDTGDYERHLRLSQATRVQPGWARVQQRFENLYLLLKEVQQEVGRLSVILGGSNNQQVDDRDGLLLELSVASQKAEELVERLESTIIHPDRKFVYWCTVSPQTEIPVLKGAPIDVGSLLQEELFAKKESVIFTSATLSTAGRFTYVKERLGLDTAEELGLGTPFDYQKAVLLYLPYDVPPPDVAGYQHAVQEALLSIARAAQGRTLALFTSHGALRAVYGLIQAPLAQEGIRVLGQGIDGSPRHLLNVFRGDARSILLGTSSFWEGVDVPGDALSVLVVTRVPFAVPTDPVFSARAEAFDDPFNDYAVPQAALRFKQGFGRLIRRKTDRGVVVVLDKRIQSRSYGGAFLSSLPKCTIQTGPLRELPKEIARWLGA